MTSNISNFRSTILVDHQIRVEPEFMVCDRNGQPLDTEEFDRRLQPASFELTLDTEVIRFKKSPGHRVVLGEKSSLLNGVKMKVTEHLVLAPGEMALAVSAECVEFGSSLVGQVNGRSSFGRAGLCVHITAGFIDPGFKGHVTFELVNFSPYELAIPVGCSIAQLVLIKTSSPAERPYSGRYQSNKGIQPSLLSNKSK